MLEMLRFDPSKRPTAAKCAEHWRALLRPWVPSLPAQDETETAFRDTVGYLNAFLSGTAEMSNLQWERTFRAIEKLEPGLDEAKRSELADLKQRVNEMRQSEMAQAAAR